MKADMNSITVNGIEYVAKGQGKPNGNRAVVVVDRGWIFAGDVTEANGRIRLSRAVWVFRWSSIGFTGVIANPKDSNVDIRKSDDVDIPSGAEVFRVPVADDWGL
jgi:hypothetical protein